jgi:hypothetical protein
MGRGHFNAAGISVLVVALTAACGSDNHQLGSVKNAGVVNHQHGSVVKNPGVVAIPHALFDPSSADAIARRASYSAWVELDKQRENPPTLDLAVWPSRSAAMHALAEYRRGGPKTRPLASSGWPHRVRRVEQIRNVTLAWFQPPTIAYEKAVRGALRFSGERGGNHDYTTLWLIPGTRIDADATAATGAARYSARLEAVAVPGRCLAGGCSGSVVGPVTFAIWPSKNAAKRYIDEFEDLGTPVTRIRNATLEAADFSDASVSDEDVDAVKNALR